MPGLSVVPERSERNRRVRDAVRLSIDASRFSQDGTCVDVVRGTIGYRSRVVVRTRFLLDSAAARLVDVLRTPRKVLSRFNLA